MVSRSSVLALLGVLLGSPLLAADDAFAVLARLRDTYAGLVTYHDQGTIEIEDAGLLRAYRFETVATGKSFRLTLSSADAVLYRVLWRQDDAAFLYDQALAQYQPLRSATTGIVAILGPGGLDALVVAATLAGSRAALEDPESAELGSEEPCGEATCVSLTLSRMGSTVTTRLLVERGTWLVREVVAAIEPADGRWEDAAGRRIRVRHEVLAAGTDVAPELAAFTPPEGARLVEELGATDEAIAAETEPAGEADLPGFSDEVSVELVSIVARVVASNGEPLLGLGPEDFRVTCRGEDVRVAAVDWVSSDPSLRDEALLTELARHGVRLPPEEKHVVFFVQPGQIASRISGQMRVLPELAAFLDTLSPNDRAAVVTFTSRLKLWVDFTRRHDEVTAALTAALGSGDEPRLRRRGATYLSEHLDPRAARDAATPDRGLEVLADALVHVPGEKVLIYLGWGLAEGGRSADYLKALRALVASRTTVFVLDTTSADYHTLEEGLRGLAVATGGFYESTQDFAGEAATRIAHAISGHYVLSLDRRDLPAANERVRVRLRRREGRVLVVPGSGGS